MANTKPFVAAALVCERVLTEQDGVQSAIRIVDRYTIHQFTVPAMVPAPESGPMQLIDLTALVVLKAGDLRGPSKASIVSRFPDGRTTTLPVEWKLNFKGDDAGESLVTRFLMPANSPEGVYWFDVVWEGQVLTSIPLRLVRESQSVAPTQNEKS